MGRWTEFEEDAYRLPHGMKRVAYDADTRIYTFRDEKGQLYSGVPGEDYGVLTPVSNNPVSSRPEAFDSGQSRVVPMIDTGNPPSSFHDILPSSFLTTPSASADAQSRSPRSPKFPKSPKSPPSEGPVNPRARFVDAVRRSAMPKVQGVVHNLRRSVTTSRAKNPFNPHKTPGENEGYHALLDASDLRRSASMATGRSSISNDTVVGNDTPVRSHS